ncbi:MAG: hypothetical protein NPINA01_11940 [Nitrospinaceae bacterium]|nr:MAG: hypothetical protein NPINA01_11940 [Nitrospinaceae bacterium]
MFYEVKVLNPDGTMKKVVSSDDLKKTHWDNFRKAEESMSLQTSDRRKVPQWVKETLDAQFPDGSEYRYGDH